MCNYVISLISATQRREHIQQEFDKNLVKFKFFDAITPEIAVDLVEQMGLNYNNNYLSQGELAYAGLAVCQPATGSRRG